MIVTMTFACASFLAGAAEPALAPRLPEIPFEKYQLTNGLQVILHEDHSTPIAAVNHTHHFFRASNGGATGSVGMKSLICRTTGEVPFSPGYVMLGM